ncbi:uncharacterized protein [Coffea arabica]|uniref:Uncharacterized protein n=1 Tax=Coffea arabica TaxID=13443 RepID=A0A6P6STT4_COFAR|nr:uncharacterized protein LOC113694567 [Coffea arabica]XP_027069205.1 uncharacterized protein LOC113694567 [Coffea arabica]
MSTPSMAIGVAMSECRLLLEEMLDGFRAAEQHFRNAVHVELPAFIPLMDQVSAEIQVLSQTAQDVMQNFDKMNYLCTTQQKLDSMSKAVDYVDGVVAKIEENMEFYNAVKDSFQSKKDIFDKCSGVVNGDLPSPSILNQLDAIDEKLSSLTVSFREVDQVLNPIRGSNLDYDDGQAAAGHDNVVLMTGGH